MKRGNINLVLKTAEAQSRIIGLLAAETFTSRNAFGRRVCETFDFRNRGGRLQVAGCLKVLRTLASNHPEIRLPDAQPSVKSSGPRLLAQAIPEPEAVPDKLKAVRNLNIIWVETSEDRAIWNTLIAREHPQGIATFAGQQLRYLFHSEHGYLGAAGFAAAALKVRARDHWIAWSESVRKAQLDRMVCLNRFLIRSRVRCRNLASHLLGTLLRRLPEEFQTRYNQEPWLVETYLDEGYQGTCLKAANFILVGKTAGRGRQDRKNLRQKTVKRIFVRPLRRDWRRRLGVPRVELAATLPIGAGLNSEEWAANEFGEARLGDQRLTARLIKSASLLAEYPGRAINANDQSDEAAICGYYRLIEQPETSEVTVPNILAPHRERSLRRMRGQKTVLAIQDGTDFNFTTRPGCEDLSLIGQNQTQAKAFGLHLHATLAVTDQGLPLGLLRLGFDPTPEVAAQSERLASQRWLAGWKDCADAASQLTRRTQVISVCDREADMFELFHAQRQRPRTELLVRARHDRKLKPEEAKLFATIKRQRPADHLSLEVDGLTERPKSSRKAARPTRKKRVARCVLRFCHVTLPATKTYLQADPVRLSAVHVEETDPPEEEKPLQWYLLTSVEVKDAEKAAEMVRFYNQRWRIEDFFRVLKSGCKAEYLMFRTASRLQRAIAINAVIAWRIMVMTLLGRQVPDCDPKLMFSDEELSFLKHYALALKMKLPNELGNAVRLVAELGGYRGRKHDTEPGNQIMWYGYTKLSGASLGHRYGYGAKCAEVYEAAYKAGFEAGKKAIAM